MDTHTTQTRTRRRNRGTGRGLAAALVAAGLVVGVTACGSSGGTSASSSGSPAGSPSVSAASQGSTAATGGSSPSASGTGTQSGTASQTDAGTAPTASAASNGGGAPSASGHAVAHTGVPRCTTSQLKITLGPASPGAGQLYYPLVFTNVTGHPCALVGYPGVSLLDGGGKTIGKPATRASGGGSTPHVLAAGRSVYAALHTANAGMSDKPCWKTSSKLLVYPPNSKQSATVPGKIRVCAGTFEVQPVAAGTHP